MNALDWLLEFTIACCGFWSNEKPKQKASNGELRRWFAKGCVKMNGVIVQFDALIPEIKEIVLFPKNDAKRTSFLF